MLISFMSSLLRRRRVLILLPLYPLVFFLCFRNLENLTSSSSKAVVVRPATTTIITAYYKLRSKHSHAEVCQGEVFVEHELQVWQNNYHFGHKTVFNNSSIPTDQ